APLPASCNRRPGSSPSPPHFSVRIRVRRRWRLPSKGLNDASIYGAVVNVVGPNEKEMEVLEVYSAYGI
ncbi:hypothetical protein PIB30_092117, partial [Stylosanthes scabra]|nr:hypothetical protein [Stylosanthes scabra]